MASETPRGPPTPYRAESIDAFLAGVGHQNLGNDKKVTAEDERRNNYDRSPSNIRLMLTFLLS